tara:strand:- start:1287 stop:1391 length:105 start_codon:yes stop_codon:yes gene_type:complete
MFGLDDTLLAGFLLGGGCILTMVGAYILVKLILR